ncbi:glycosyltransferase [Yinghuangia aomiensis]
MQMNDDSMLTFYALLAGDTVHQPSSLVFTLAPERFRHYMRQQMRWMRGTTVRHLWWLRYMPANGVVFWSTVGEYLHLVLGITIPAVLLAVPEYRAHLGTIAVLTLAIGAAAELPDRAAPLHRDPHRHDRDADGTAVRRRADRGAVAGGAAAAGLLVRHGHVHANQPLGHPGRRRSTPVSPALLDTPQRAPAHALLAA